MHAECKPAVGGASVTGSVTSTGSLENIVSRSQDHILVIMNYRLGTLGFLALKELSEVDPRGVSGNYGILDQQLALKWVAQNIEYFGGDRGSVTIFGQSSGGTSVLAHLSSRGSQGLFHRAIVLSGSPNITMGQTDKEAQDRELWLPMFTTCNASNLSASQLRDCLYRADAKKLTAQIPKAYSAFEAFYDYPVNLKGLTERTLVHVDGSTVSLPVLEALEQGLNDVPLLISSMSAELSIFRQLQFGLWVDSDAQLKQFWNKRFEPVFGTDMVQEVFNHYQDVAAIKPEYAVWALDSDTAVYCGHKALAFAAGNGFRSPVYQTQVWGAPASTHIIQNPGGLTFPFHGWEVMAAAEVWSVGLYTPSRDDESFGALMRETWLNLSKHGKLPSGNWTALQDTPGWPSNYTVSKFGKRVIEPLIGFKDELCKWWETKGIGKTWWWIN